MTVSSTNTKNSYSGDDSTVVFAYTFKVFDDDDIQVILRNDTTGAETVQTKTTHYSVSGVGNTGGGNITFVTAPATGETVVLLRAIPLTQTTDYTPNDPFPAATHEDALDRLTFIVQDQQEELDRAIKISKTNTITSPEFTVGATTRANKIFAFDSSGDLSVTQEIGTYQGTDTTTTTSAYSERDIIKSTTAAQLNNVYICVADSVAGDLLTDTDHFELLVDAVSAATSATAAASSATAAASSATAAAASESAAATSETNAATSASNASTSETNAASSASAASTSASNASTSETNAASSATAAASSATAAAASATAAAASESAAATSETNAATSASNASTSETNAASSASSASTSATNAATSETNAATSASNASTSETNAASSASAAAASQTAAAASAASAASAYDSFDDRYLGVKASDPTVDNDGDPLSAGLLYFSSSENIMKVYDGASWIAATSAGNVSLILYEYTATSGQTTFSGADDNAATLSYTVNNIQVVMNGIVLDPSDFTATTGTSVVLASGAAANDLVNIYAFQSFTVADTVSASAGGTFSANVAVTGDLTVDTNTLHVDATNNRVGIKTDSPDVTTHIVGSAGKTTLASHDAQTIAVVENNADAQFAIVANSANSSQLFFGDESSELVGRIRYDHSTNAMRLYTNGSEAVRILSGGGLTFNGDTAAANALDDYEEGTFTPSYGQGVSSATYSVQAGRYTKVGNRVFFEFEIDGNSITGDSNTLYITGLPFTAHNAVPRSGATLSYTGGVAGSVQVTSIIFNNTNTMGVYKYNDGGTVAGNTLNLNGGWIWFGHYDI